MKWHTRVRTKTGGIDAYIRIVAPDYISAGKRAQQKAAAKFKAGKFANVDGHLYGKLASDWVVTMVSLHST